MPGIPVVISSNGLGIPVKAVASGAPLMTVSSKGLGASIVLSEKGTPFIVENVGPQSPILLSARFAGVGLFYPAVARAVSVAPIFQGNGLFSASLSAKKSISGAFAGFGIFTPAVSTGSATMYSQISSILGSSLVSMVDATDASARSGWTFATGGGADGSTISAVPDMTGARTFSQATAANQPTLGTLSDGKKAIIWPDAASMVSLDPAAAWSFAWVLVCLQYRTGAEATFASYESFLGVVSGKRLQGNSGGPNLYPNTFSNTASKNFSATQSAAVLPLPVSTLALGGTPVSQKWGLGTGDVSGAYWKGPIRGMIAANAIPNSTQLASIHALCQSYWGAP